MFDQIFYSLTRWNCHFQDVGAELGRLKAFLDASGVRPRDLVDVGCGDGAITAAVGALLGFPETWGLDLNRQLLARAARRGVRAVCQDMTLLSLERRFDLVVSYGSLHHVENAAGFIRGLAALSRRYVLIVDNTVRRTVWHRLTGSRYFPLESSSHPIRSVEDIVAGLKDARCTIVGVRTSRNANIWHDRSFILAEIDGRARAGEIGPATQAPAPAVQRGERLRIARPSRPTITSPATTSSTDK
jgi:SAM-dependent methyltransferase